MDRARSKSRITRRARGFYLSLGRRIWNRLSPSGRLLPLGRAYGQHLDGVVRLYADRKQYFATFFLRNRPELELLCRLAAKRPYGARLNLCILACSKGAEVYSVAWAIRSARPDLHLAITAIDISPEIVAFASRGIYSFSKSDALPPSENQAKRGSVSWNTARDQNAWMFERMSKEEIDTIFDAQGETAIVQSWLREGIRWMCGDAGDPGLQSEIGPQDIVMANRFLCHMEPVAAEACLRNIANLLIPGGHLFVSGIDLDVRTRVAQSLQWSPVQDLLREIHDGDHSIRRGWPLEYWGLEPLDERRADWQVRYASAFQVGASSEMEQPAVLASGKYEGTNDIQTNQHLRRMGD